MIDVLEQAARAGGTILNNYFRKTYYKSHKGTPRNIVTQADLESQKTICDTITALLAQKGIDRKEIGFIGEENLHSLKKHTFIIDPLDGTTNFSVGIPLFCIPIAYVADNTVQASVVYAPTTDTLYLAEKNQGAYKVSPAGREKLDAAHKPLSSLVVSAHLSGHPTPQHDELLSIITALQPVTLGIRHLGVVALEQCWFAENILGVVLNSRNYIWDTAATQLIVEESGGIVVDFQNKPLTYDLSAPEKTYHSIALHPNNRDAIMQIIA